MRGAGAKRVSNAEGIPRIVRKHDCALPAQYTKHSNARGVSLEVGYSLTKALRGRSKAMALREEASP